MLRLLRLAVLVIVVWSLLVHGLPGARRAIPFLCARRNLTGGFCRPDILNRMAALDAWVQAHLQPLPRHPRVRQVLREAHHAVGGVEETARRRAGDERVDQVVRGARAVLGQVEELAGGAGEFSDKLGAVPRNANLLLARVRDAFDRLHRVLSRTTRRAGEVTAAVEDAERALDALSETLPRRPGAAGAAGTRAK